MRPPPSDPPTPDANDPREPAPTIDASAGVDPTATEYPLTIGRYRIIGKLGQGSMGIVFEVEQDHPRRRVALKVIRGGTFVDEQRVRMFQREVETLALLKHPNIGAIYDAGRTDSGEHFFAMELVRGKTLDEYLESRPRTLDNDELRFRLRLFRSLCGAVNYAHQRGVIHRDLKPSNVIVSDAEGGSESRAGDMPELKVLDFGLARITGTDLEAATAVTEVGVIKGTLPYMSPEQARGEPDRIDLRSDVYALGVILYEMLTGVRPYDTQRVSIMEALRVICDQPPAALERSWMGLRRPDADLQTIVGKALEKDPDRRYGSAATLAEDVERYLDSRPILARAPSTLYQLRKFARRNRTLVAGLAATMLALIAGIIATTTFGLREAAQRRTAQKAQQDTQAVADFQSNMLSGVDAPQMGRRLADDLIARLSAGRREAGASAGEVESSVASFRSLLGNINTTDAALRVIDEDILAQAIAAAQTQFADRPDLRAQLMHSIGQTYFRLGLLDKAEAVTTKALALYDSTAGPGAASTLTVMHSLGDIYEYQGRVATAESLLVLALAGQKQLGGTESDDALQTMNSLALLYEDTGRLASSDSLYAIILPIQRRRHGDDSPYTLDVMHNYAWTLINEEKYPQAESLATRTLAGRRRVFGIHHPQTMQAVNNLGVLYKRMGRLDEAEPLYREDYEVSRQQLGDEHPDMLPTMTNLGRLLIAQKKFSEAEALLGKALATSKKVQPPGFLGTGITELAYAEALVGLERYRDAEPRLLDAYKILVAIQGKHDPGVQRAVQSLVTVSDKLGHPAQASKWRGELAAAPTH